MQTSCYPFASTATQSSTVLLYYPSYLTSESLFFCKMCFQQEQQFRALMALSAPAAPVFNLGEKSEIRDFVCKCDRNRKVDVQIRDTVCPNSFLWEERNFSLYLVANTAEFRCILPALHIIFYANLKRSRNKGGLLAYFL